MAGGRASRAVRAGVATAALLASAASADTLRVSGFVDYGDGSGPRAIGGVLSDNGPSQPGWWFIISSMGNMGTIGIPIDATALTLGGIALGPQNPNDYRYEGLAPINLNALPGDFETVGMNFSEPPLPGVLGPLLGFDLDLRADAIQLAGDLLTVRFLGLHLAAPPGGAPLGEIDGSLQNGVAGIALSGTVESRLVQFLIRTSPECTPFGCLPAGLYVQSDVTGIAPGGSFSLDAVAVPEPGTAALVAVGTALLARRRARAAGRPGAE
ncbi:MAG TPA: hypothetical protein DEP35_23960 [Deltaproteobacteria bacterium]|jgi:hypothetical protein|nr:hypothetical protein [Deltaproteobacteria bacterium]